MVYHAYAGPFWQMRQSILANAPVYFDKYLILFNDFKFPVSRPNGISNINKINWRIRQNGLAHSPKWTSVCMIHHTCVYIRVGWGLLRRGPRGAQPPGKGPEPQKPPARSNIYTCMVYHACAGPFWRMRQSILANAPVHFIECTCLFGRVS